eukprot:TRINITY_DN3022_c0_g1_i1.p1 TRINITY_DN3022_c0_g1~~TRINITY_DN3022_c0_g1_i1.p1  ORF type:complete len:169 (-),score=14.96 TRINITY_DN3022_c0_g1_i1:2079-2585(-)
MGLLDTLWDDTMGGSQPDSGLGKLRKLAVPASPQSPFGLGAAFSPRTSLDYDSPRSSIVGSPGNGMTADDRARRTSLDSVVGSPRAVTRSITIARSPIERATSLPSAFGTSPSGYRRDEKVRRNVFGVPDSLDRTASGSVAHSVAENRRVSGEGTTPPVVYDWYNRLD